MGERDYYESAADPFPKPQEPRTEYRVTTSYADGPDVSPQVCQEDIFKALGCMPDDSGSGGGWRDLGWQFKKRVEAQDFLQHAERSVPHLPWFLTEVRYGDR